MSYYSAADEVKDKARRARAQQRRRDEYRDQLNKIRRLLKLPRNTEDLDVLRTLEHEVKDLTEQLSSRRRTLNVPANATDSEILQALQREAKETQLMPPPPPRRIQPAAAATAARPSLTSMAANAFLDDPFQSVIETSTYLSPAELQALLDSAQT